MKTYLQSLDIYLVFSIFCACALIAIWAYCKAFESAKYYKTKREPKPILTHTEKGWELTTTIGGEQ